MRILDYVENSMEDGVELGPDQVSSKEVREVINSVRTDVGVDVSDVHVGNLNGNIAGVFHLNTRRIEIDEEIIHAEEFQHVLTHEAFHKLHLEKRRALGMGQISDLKVEEALNELSTKEVTGEVIAYQDYISYLKTLLHGSDNSVSAMLDDYRAGNSDEINRIIDEAA